MSIGEDGPSQMGLEDLALFRPSDRVTIIAAGVTVAEALRAADALAADGVPARVIDLYSVKPVDTQTLRDAAEVTENFVTVEDHWPEGALGDAVLAVSAMLSTVVT